MGFQVWGRDVFQHSPQPAGSPTRLLEHALRVDGPVTPCPPHPQPPPCTDPCSPCRLVLEEPEQLMLFPKCLTHPVVLLLLKMVFEGIESRPKPAIWWRSCPK